MDLRYRRAGGGCPQSGRPTRATGLGLGLVAAILAITGCTGSLDNHRVFANSSENLKGTVHTDEIVDVVVEFDNITDSAVRLSAMSLADFPPYIHLVGTSSYDSRRLGYFPAENLGDLPKECPHEYVPSAIDSITVKPGQLSNWFGVLAIRILKPGRYTLRRIRIAYSVDGRPGWQYQNTNLTLRVRNPPLPGPRPVPSSEVC